MKNSRKIETAPNFHSRAFKKARIYRTQKYHFDSVLQYKNPILGVQVALEEKLNENKLIFHNSIARKKELLIDALEDLTLATNSYRNQIKQAIFFWRKPVDEDAEVRLRTTKQDIEVAQKHLDQMRQQYESMFQSVKEIEDEIKQVEDETLEYERKTEEAKKKIFMDLDSFAHERMIKDQLTDLQKQYDDMFNMRNASNYSPENQSLAEDNEKQRKIMERLRYEVEIAVRVSQRLRMVARAKNRNNNEDDDSENDSFV